MSYYTRILTPSAARVPVAELQAALKAAKVQARLEIEEGSAEEWKQLAVTDRDGGSVLTIERNDVSEGGVGHDEIQEFLEEIPNYRPASAVKWLQNYLPTIRTIYAFQHLDGMSKASGRRIFDTLQTALWSKLGGIFQADNEGFSNEQGYHILWQFCERVNGLWSMALRDESGHWNQFQMDLGNSEHRESFKHGRIPAGCALINKKQST